MSITKRSHYNPCFWTAFWNPQYYEAFQNGQADNLIPREQMVYALSAKSSRIYSTTVDNVHYEKNIGTVEVTYEVAKKFCKRYRPDMFAEFLKSNRSSDYPVLLDVEDLLTFHEGITQYKEFIKVIKYRDVRSIPEKTNLAYGIFFQLLRSHAVMNAAIEWNEKLGGAKFEYFIILKWMLSDPNFMYQRLIPMINSNWMFYRTSNDRFPLTDSPVLINSNSIMIAFSPKLLLEIPSKPSDTQAVSFVKEIDESKYEEFRKRTIGNTFREIIFGHKDLLDEWRTTDEFKERVSLIQKMGGYNILVAKEKGREIWRLNAFSGQNQSFAEINQAKRKRHRSKTKY